MDPEIEAMTKIAEALSQLDETVRERVLRWAAERYVATPRKPMGAETPVERSNETGIAQCADLGELFAAAGPLSESDGTLVASYWFEEMEGFSSVDALTVNKALKQLGHGVKNITRAFTRLQGEKPSLMVQVKKKGRTKQARKEYKVTAAGAGRVEEMISGRRE